MINRYAAALSLFTLCQGVAVPSWAEDELIGVWKLSCGEGPCQAFISANENGEFAVAWSLLHNVQTNTNTSIIRLPDMVALQPGVRVILADESHFTLPFQFCDQGSCTAIAEMEDNIVETLGNAETARIAFYRYGETKVRILEIPVKGFSDALEHLAKGDAEEQK